MPFGNKKLALFRTVREQLRCSIHKKYIGYQTHLLKTFFLNVSGHGSHISPVTHRCILIYGEQVSLLNDIFQEWRKIRKNLLARFWLLTIRMLVLYTERTDDD